MLKIRLMRIGGKKRPFYRVVVVDERAKRTGGYLELLGTYNPLTEPKDVKLTKDRIDYWIKMGAQPSIGYLRMIGKAPKRPPRKPKKEKKAEESAAPQPTAESKVQVKEEKIEETEVKSDADSRLSEPGELENQDQTNEGALATTDESTKPKPNQPAAKAATETK